MENLLRLTELIENRASICRVPAYFNIDNTAEASGDGYITVDLCDMVRRCVKDHFLNAGEADFVSDKRDFVIYSMLIRSAAAFITEDSMVCAGTFLKALLLLPKLKRMGVNTIYLLPVFETSPLYKKGGASSPYAVADYMKLNPGLHDEIVGEYSEELLNIEFKAFVEACHSLGMRVVLDFVFRTIGRQNALIAEHPDWFYWIKTDGSKTFAAPKVKAIKGQQGISVKNVKKVYADVPKEHFEKFSINPKEIDAERWKNAASGENILSAIENTFSLTTAPAFSDWINDAQPPWTDVTYFRYDMAQNDKQTNAPFVLFDNIKLNLFPPKEPNRELYDYIAGIIPFYRDMGVDGARIDMAHALPVKLLAAIHTAVKAKDPDFILWSEEFNASNAASAKGTGFEMISGNTWYYLPRLRSGRNWHNMIKQLILSELPAAASLETPDSPRIALKYAGKRLELAHMIYALLPNCAMFINAGQELREIQPMNLGLDNTEKGRFVLNADDPMYGKLAFFDDFAPRYSGKDYLHGCIAKTVEIRKAYSDFIKDGKCAFGKRGEIFYLGYSLKDKRVCFVFNMGETQRGFKKKPFTDKKIIVAGCSYKIID